MLASSGTDLLARPYPGPARWSSHTRGSHSLGRHLNERGRVTAEVKLSELARVVPVAPDEAEQQLVLEQQSMRLSHEHPAAAVSDAKFDGLGRDELVRETGRRASARSRYVRPGGSVDPDLEVR